MKILLTPFVWLLMAFYNLFSNYGIALILFAVVVKAILFPFALKGKKSMIQMTMLSGKMQQIQKKYANDKDRQNLEIQKLYEKEKVNPMGGCLWSFLPILVLLPLYAIIRQPLDYMMSLGADAITQIAAALNWDGVAVNMGWTTAQVVEKAVKAAQEAGTTYLTSYQNAGYNQLYLASMITPETLTAAQTAAGEAGSHIFAIDFNFLGLNLAHIPNWRFWENGISWNSIGLFFIPVVSAVSGFLFSFISNKTNAVNNQNNANAQQNSTNKMMYIMMPIMSLWIGFAMPAGLGIYWIANNLLSMVQEFISGKLLKKDYERAAEARAEQERLEKEEEKRKRHEAAERKAQAIADAKANKGKKKVQQPVEKKKNDSSVIEVSRVGIRSYARGRAYDPYRFSPDGPTPYKEPGAPIDETAVEKALKKKSDKLEEVALEAAADDMIVEEIMEEKAAAAQKPTDANEETIDGDPWAKLDQEISEIMDPPAEESDQNKE